MTMASDPTHNQHVASDGNPSSTTAAMEQVQLDTNTPQPVRHWTEGDALNTSSESTRRFSQRLSFFGRSSSDAVKPPIVNPAMTTPNNPGIDALIDQQRPSTSQSESKRRTADHFGNIRNSIFGSRKLASASGQADSLRPSSRDSQRSKASRKSQSLDRPRISSSLLSFTLQGDSKTPGKEGQFHSAKEYYRHHKKCSISPPFNFQHVTHTAKKHLPKLETVDEKDLAAKFWAVNAYQKPKEQLSGIKAEQLEKPRERSLSSGAGRPRSSQRVTQESTSSPSAASCTATNDVDETTFDETHETKFNPDDVYRSLEDIHDAKLSTSPRRSSPKQCSSTSALSSLSSQSRYPQGKGQASFDESFIARSPTRPVVPPRARTSLPVESTENTRALDQSFYNKQLPAIPQEEADRKDSEMSRDSSSSANYSLFPAPPGQIVCSNAPAARPKRPSMSVATLGSQQAEVLNETTWEDDIDFAYEQEAEAMCDFDWESARPLHPEISEGDSTVPSSQPSPGESSGASSPGGVRLSASIYQPSAFTSATSISNRERSSSTATSSFSSTEHVNRGHKRGSSVGHKGFQAARRTTGDGVVKTSPSLPLQFVPEASTATPPPTFSLTDADIESTKKLPNDPAYFPTTESVMPGYLSDPESAQTDGSRHRKSSSYGSYQSSERSLLFGSDTTRWSSTSTSSLPDLLSGKRKSRSSVAKRRNSRPLESVPHSPTFIDDDVPGEHHLTVPARNSLWDKEQLDPTFMRRPSSPGDRQVLYSAGRFVQRGRSATPSRLPQRSTADNNEAGWI